MVGLSIAPLSYAKRHDIISLGWGLMVGELFALHVLLMLVARGIGRQRPLRGMPVLSPNEIGSPIVHAAHDYWRSKVKPDRLPSRQDIDPAEIPKLLRHVLLTEIRAEPFQAHYRLAGTALAEIYGFDYTGTDLSREREGDEGYAYYVEIYRRICREKAPLFGCDGVHIRDRPHIQYDWVELPLVDDSGAVAMTFAVGELYKRPKTAR